MSKCLVLLFYRKQYWSQKEAPKKYLYEVDQELGGGEMSLFACPGVGNRPPGKNKFANLQGCAGGLGGETMHYIQGGLCYLDYMGMSQYTSVTLEWQENKLFILDFCICMCFSLTIMCIWLYPMWQWHYFLSLKTVSIECV